MSRRKSRRTKAGANPGGDERSWAEYGGVGLTPSSDHSPLPRLLLPAAAIGILVSLTVVLCASWEPFNHTQSKSASIMDIALAYAIPVLLAVGGALCAIVIGFGLVRFVQDLFSEK